MVPPDNKPGGIRGNRPRLRGEVIPRPAAPVPQRVQPVPQASPPAPVATKKQVLFVCIGNSCRSQMAEAFAKAYGADIMQVQSAGLSPAMSIAPMTGKMLAERNLNLNGHFPKNIELVQGQMFDLIVNISGHPLKVPGTPVITWTVQDPIGQKEAVYQQVVSQIESLVMSLILTLRSGRLPA
jgi:arsenate reductase